MGESVDIVVSEAGTEQVTDRIEKLGVTAETTAQSVDKTNQSLEFLQTAANATTSPLESMANAAQSTTQALDENYKLVYNVKTGLYDIVAANREAGVSFRAHAADVDALGFSAGGAAEQIDKLKHQTDQHAQATDGAKHSTEGFHEATKLLTEALKFLGLALSVEKLIELAETFEIMEIKVSSVSRSSHDLEENMHRLFEISQQTGSSFQSNAAAFQKLSVETTGLNISQKDLLSVISGVDSAVRLSGGTTKDAARAMDVFSRSLATGQVEGRIFRTVLRDFPELGQLVAKGLNVPISALTGFGSAAKTSSKDFVEGFNRAAKTAEEVGKTIPLTLGAAIQTLVNAAVNYVGHLNEATHTTGLMALAVRFLAEHFDAIATTVRVVATAFGAWYAIAVVIPGAISLIVAGLNAITAAALANPFTFMIAAITTLIALVYQFGNQIKLTSDGSITLLGALLGAWNLLRDGIMFVYELFKGPLTAAWEGFAAVVTLPFKVLMAIVEGAITLLEKFGAKFEWLGGVAEFLASPFAKLKAIVVDAMQEATAKLNETTEASKTLAQQLGGDEPTALAGGATKASGAVKQLGEDLTQMGRVNAALIPPFENLAREQKRNNDLIDAAKDNFKNYVQSRTDGAKDISSSTQKMTKDTGSLQQATQDLSVTTRDAMGNIIKYASEAANQTADQYNKMSKSIDTVTDSLERQVSAQAAAAAPPLTGAQSIDLGGQFTQHTNKMLEGGTSNDGGNTFQLPGESLLNYQRYGYPLGNPYGAIAWNDLLLATADEVLKGKIRADAHSRRIPGFATGADFRIGGGGGPDSRLVQFFGSPEETVLVETPAQRRARLSAATNPAPGKGVQVNMTVVTKDANSFNRSQHQTLMQLKSRLSSLH